MKSVIELEPVLVKLTDNPGVNQPYTFLPGYKFADLLICSGGAAGGTSSYKHLYCGGSSGLILYIENFKLNNLQNTTMQYNLAKASSNTGYPTVVTIDNKVFTLPGGGGNSSLKNSTVFTNKSLITNTFGNYIDSIDNINICGNGGGAAGVKLYNRDNGRYTYGVGGNGSSMSQDGIIYDDFGSGGGSSGTPIGKITNKDGHGGYTGGQCNRMSANDFNGIDIEGGTGFRLNDKIIPIVSVFGSTGTSGARGHYSYDRGAGGGAAGYGNGGDPQGATQSDARPTDGQFGGGGGGARTSTYSAGKGGQGIICIYYHN